MIVPLLIGELSGKSACLHLPQDGRRPSLVNGNLFFALQWVHLT
jgi:hypothetical protein